jgi:hypothetical protein
VADVDGVQGQPAAAHLRRIRRQRHELEHHVVDRIVRLGICQLEPN